MVKMVASNLLRSILGRLFPKGAGSGLGFGLGIGAGSAVGAGLGGSAVTIAMVPFNAVNNYLGSFYFGAGMILGERWMYQEVWPKIQERVKSGESFMTLVEPYIIEAQSMLMKNAEIIGKDIATSMSSGSLSFLSELLSGDLEGSLEFDAKEEDIIIPPPKEDVPHEERDEKIEETTEKVEDIGWQKIVGPGKNRKQVTAAIKKFEEIVSSTQKQLRNRNLSNRQTATLNTQLKLYLLLTKQYKEALSWLNRNSPKNTP